MRPISEDNLKRKDTIELVPKRKKKFSTLVSTFRLQKESETNYQKKYAKIEELETSDSIIFIREK